MHLALTDERHTGSDRLDAIRLALLTLRMMEHWRKVWGDIDTALIVLGVSAVLAERLTRIDLTPELRNMNREPSPDFRVKLGTCSLSSIAAATGLNRETTRRKVNQMVQDGILVRSNDGKIQFAAKVAQRGDVQEMVRQQLRTVTRTANELIRDGSIEVRDGDDGSAF